MADDDAPVARARKPKSIPEKYFSKRVHVTAPKLKYDVSGAWPAAAAAAAKRENERGALLWACVRAPRAQRGLTRLSLSRARASCAFYETVARALARDTADRAALGQAASMQHRGQVLLLRPRQVRACCGQRAPAPVLTRMLARTRTPLLAHSEPTSCSAATRATTGSISVRCAITRGRATRRRRAAAAAAVVGADRFFFLSPSLSRARLQRA